MIDLYFVQVKVRCLPLLGQFLVDYYQQIRVQSSYVWLNSNAALVELLS